MWGVENPVCNNIAKVDSMVKIIMNDLLTQVYFSWFTDLECMITKEMFQALLYPRLRLKYFYGKRIISCTPRRNYGSCLTLFPGRYKVPESLATEFFIVQIRQSFRNRIWYSYAANTVQGSSKRNIPSTMQCYIVHSISAVLNYRLYVYLILAIRDLARFSKILGVNSCFLMIFKWRIYVFNFEHSIGQLILYPDRDLSSLLMMSMIFEREPMDWGDFESKNTRLAIKLQRWTKAYYWAYMNAKDSWISNVLFYYLLNLFSITKSRQPVCDKV